MKSLSDWPQMKPFNGHRYGHAALYYATYQQRWHEGVLNWDTDAIRKGILEEGKSIPIPLVDKAPGADASAWDKAPIQTLRMVNDMPRVTIGTTFQVLRDRENLYVRVVSRYPANHPEDVPTAKTEADVFKSEYVTLALRPLKGDTIYQLAINPATESRFDARIPLGANGEPKVDESWSGKWQFENHTTLQKGPYTLPARVWTSYFKIPFSDFGVKAPASGEAWGFNLERVRVKESGNHDLIWSNGKSVTHPETQGTLLF